MVAILFLIPPDMAITVGVIFSIPDACAHLNVRIPLGRFVTWVNNPQWHRIHHSVLMEHRNKNFASFFPIWDILFGTAWGPTPGEYPATGPVPAERVDIINSVIWPVRPLRTRSLKMNWVKALLLLACLLVGYADLVTTNVILNHGLGELNPFIPLAQTWLGAWWLIPKLGGTFVVMWLLSRSNKLYHIAFAIALFSTPVLNNLIIIAGMK